MSENVHKPTILCVVDSIGHQQNLRLSAAKCLAISEHYQLVFCQNLTSAFEHIKNDRNLAVVVSDVDLSEIGGLGILEDEGIDFDLDAINCTVLEKPIIAANQRRHGPRIGFFAFSFADVWYATSSAGVPKGWGMPDQDRDNRMRAATREMRIPKRVFFMNNSHQYDELWEKVAEFTTRLNELDKKQR